MEIMAKLEIITYITIVNVCTDSFAHIHNFEFLSSLWTEAKPNSDAITSKRLWKTTVAQTTPLLRFYH